MADVKQLYSVLNAVSRDALGETTTLTMTDTHDFVSVGRDIISSQTTLDKWVGALMDRIGRTIVSSRVWNDPSRDPLVRKGFEFGSALQKLYVDLIEAEANKSWEIGQQGYVPVFAPVKKPDARQKIFNKISTWEFPITIPDNIVRTAFTSPERMQAWIDSIFVSMENSVQLSLRNANNLTRATAIASCYDHGASAGADAPLVDYDLGAEYRAAGGTSHATLDGYIGDPAFLRFFARRVKDILKYMTDMSRAFNIEHFARHTPTDELVVNMLQALDSALAVNLESDTFHNELVRIPGYSTVSYWQGATDYTNANLSGVSVTIDDLSGDGATTDIEVSGVLGMAHDREALGTSIFDRHMTTERNNHDEYTNYYQKANIGYFFDPSENCVIFRCGIPTT